MKKFKPKLLIIETSDPGKEIVLKLESLEKLNLDLKKTIDTNTNQLDQLRKIIKGL